VEVKLRGGCESDRDESGDVFFADAKADRIYKAGVDGKVVVLKDVRVE
jgi:hypothetical protein